MYQKDYILRLIEEFGTVLAKILGLKQNKQFQEAIDMIDETSLNYLKIRMNYVTSLSDKELIEVLEKDTELGSEMLGMLADLLKQQADIDLELGEKEKSRNEYQKALLLLNYLNSKELEVFSLDRMNKISTIGNQLEKI